MPYFITLRLSFSSSLRYDAAMQCKCMHVVILCTSRTCCYCYAHNGLAFAFFRFSFAMLAFLLAHNEYKMPPEYNIHAMMPFSPLFALAVGRNLVHMAPPPPPHGIKVYGMRRSRFQPIRSAQPSVVQKGSGQEGGGGRKGCSRRARWSME